MHGARRAADHRVLHHLVRALARQHHARDDAVRADAVRGVLDRHRAGQRVERALCRGVRVETGRPEHRRGRGDVHDRAACVGPGLRHLGDRVLARPDDGLERDEHDRVPRVVLELGDPSILTPGAHELGRRSVVHERRELPVAVDRGAHGRDHVGLLGEIGAHVGRLTAGGRGSRLRPRDRHPRCDR